MKYSWRDRCSRFPQNVAGIVILRHSDDRDFHRVKYSFGQTKGKHEITPVQSVLKKIYYYKLYLRFWGTGVSFHNIDFTKTKFPFTCWQYSMIDPWNTHRSKFNPELSIGIIKRTHTPHHWGWFPWSEHREGREQAETERQRQSFTSSLLTPCVQSLLVLVFLYIHHVAFPW